MGNVPVQIEPRQPFVRMNRYHIKRFPLAPGRLWSNDRRFSTMFRDDFEDGRFKEDASIIDVNCMKFPIDDVINLGSGGVLWERLFEKPRVKVQYFYGSPIQLSFKEARNEIIELICTHGWFSKTQDGETERQFRERMMRCNDMEELLLGAPNNDENSKKRYQWIGGVAFFGKDVG